MAVTVTTGKRRLGRFETLTTALAALAADGEGPARLRIDPGIYREKVEVGAYPWPITIQGAGPERTRIVWGDFARRRAPDGEELGTFRTPTMTVRGDGVSLHDLAVVNEAGSGPDIGQGIALAVYGRWFRARHVWILGHQDTLYTGGQGPQFYDHCRIEGTVDFIFGPAQAVFFQTDIISVGKGYLTAASTPEEVPWGYLFYRCRIADGDAARAFLGRPWRPFASVTFADCHLAAHIRPEGWDHWRNPDNERTARYAEYRNSGPGARVAERVEWAVASPEGPPLTSPVATTLAALDQGTYGKDWVNDDPQ